MERKGIEMKDISNNSSTLWKMSVGELEVKRLALDLGKQGQSTPYPHEFKAKTFTVKLK